jgi:hypothetical protein
VAQREGPGRSADSESRGRPTAPGASQRARPQDSPPAAIDDEDRSDDAANSDTTAIAPPEVATDDGNSGSGADRNANGEGRGRGADHRANTAQTAVPQAPVLEQPPATFTASPRGVAVTDGKDAARPASVPERNNNNNNNGASGQRGDSGRGGEH